MRHVVGAAVSVAIFVLALWALHHELHGVRAADVMAQFRALPIGTVAAALALTAASHLVLTGYDLLAFRILREPLGYPRIALGSFVAFAVGNNVGLALVSGGSMRYRIYSAAGVSGETIAKVIALVTYTFGIGVALVVGVVLVLEPDEAERIAAVPPAVATVLGWIIIAVVAAYAVWVGSRARTLRFRGIELALPGAGVTLVQMLLAAADLALSASVLYVLLPPVPGLSYPAFLGIYVLAIMAGIASHVPGGIGVFETVLLLALPDAPRDALLGAVLAYRCIYYLLPLAVAVALLVVHELSAERGRMARAGLRVGGWLAPAAPPAVGTAVLVAGAILLFSGAFPALDSRLAAAARVVPLPVLELSHLLGSAVGLALIILARGLFRRLAAAWQATMVLLGVGIAASLLRGLGIEESIILALVMLALWLARAAFYRESSLLDQRFGAGWIATIAVVVAGSVWLGLFAYRHVEYSHALWWEFAVTAHAPRFMRASVVVAVLGVGVALWKLLHGAPPAPGLPDADALERARDPGSRLARRCEPRARGRQAPALQRR
ncbi:MAG: hypothetical protein R3286_04545 [Gammaproteobacteria bacterium]|nr:hypothetical protein [Gammaproteobacteria bacterium]